MKKYAFILAILATTSVRGDAPNFEAKDAAQFATFWSSGAEITRYELSQSRYGEAHAGHAELIFVQEPFLPDAQVKSDSGGPPAEPTFKLNALRTFNTGFYSYRTMQSTFAPIDRERFPHALKTTLSVQDWCGQVFQQINFRDGKWQHRSYSYFQSEGDFVEELPEAWLEDELWLLLRRDPNSLPLGKVEVIPALLHGRFAHQAAKIETAQASLQADGNETVYQIDYTSTSRRLSIRFNTEFPHYIQGWTETSPRGTTTARRTHGMGQVEYWRLNQPKDAPLREKLGLERIPN